MLIRRSKPAPVRKVIRRSRGLIELPLDTRVQLADGRTGMVNAISRVPSLTYIVLLWDFKGRKPFITVGPSTVCRRADMLVLPS